MFIYAFVVQSEESSWSHSDMRFDLPVFPSQKISDVKNVIMHGNDRKLSKACSGREVQLWNETKETKLEDHHTLSHYKIQHGSRIIVERKLQVSICVKAENGENQC